MLPGDRMARARCRSISGEMHSGFSALRVVAADEPAHAPARLHAVVRGAADIERITEIWRECLDTWGGPWLFGRQPSVADAMYAPVVTRFRSYDVTLDAVCDAYCDADPGLARHAGMGRGGAAGAGADRGTRSRVLTSRIHRAGRPRARARRDQPAASGRQQQHDRLAGHQPRARRVGGVLQRHRGQPRRRHPADTAR